MSDRPPFEPWLSMTKEQWITIRAQLDGDRAEIERLRDAIEWIYTHPEDPKLVQAKAEEVRGE